MHNSTLSWLLFIMKYRSIKYQQPVFCGVRVTRSLVLYVCFVDRCLSFCTFSFGHCVVCSSSIYGFWLPPFGIFKLFLPALSIHIYTYAKLGSQFLTAFIVVFLCSIFWVRGGCSSLDIDGIVDHRCLNLKKICYKYYMLVLLTFRDISSRRWRSSIRFNTSAKHLWSRDSSSKLYFFSYINIKC
jgi:hypothetical protein